MASCNDGMIGILNVRVITHTPIVVFFFNGILFSIEMGKKYMILRLKRSINSAVRVWFDSFQKNKEVFYVFVRWLLYFRYRENQLFFFLLSFRKKKKSTNKWSQNALNEETKKKWTPYIFSFYLRRLFRHDYNTFVYFVVSCV